MENNNETLVLDEGAENVEATPTEEIVEVEEQVKTPAEKIYTQEEFDAKLDEGYRKKLGRKEAKLRKEYDAEYGELIGVLKKGTGEQDIKKITQSLKQFYESKGVEMEITQPDYSEKDTAILARFEAQEIIDAGDDEVADEIGRLSKLDADNMNSRDKAVLKALTAHKQETERVKALAEIGVPKSVYNSDEFKNFAKKFTSDVPVTEVYKLYSKSADTSKPEPIGSLKNGSHKEEKTYYSPEDVDKLTPADLDNPVIFKRVRESMKKWQN